MRKKLFTIILVSVSLLVSCQIGPDFSKEKRGVSTAIDEKVDERKESEEKREDKERYKEEKKNKRKEREASYEKEKSDENILVASSIEELKIEREKLKNLYGDDGNFPKHTKKEVVKQFADDDGMIKFALDDQPVRNITVDDERINNITNYSDHYIDISYDEAFVYPEEHIVELYEAVVTQSPDMIEGFERDGKIDFRSYDELTNLETALLMAIGFTGPLLNELDDMIARESFDEETYEVIREQFLSLGEPSVLIPAPQSFTDMELFNIMLIMKELWYEIGHIEDPEDDLDEFLNIYSIIREETNNLFAYLFVTLSGEYD